MGFAGISSCLCFLSFPIAVDCLNEFDVGQTSQWEEMCTSDTEHAPFRSISHWTPFVSEMKLIKRHQLSNICIPLGLRRIFLVRK